MLLLNILEELDELTPENSRDEEAFAAIWQKAGCGDLEAERVERVAKPVKIRRL